MKTKKYVIALMCMCLLFVGCVYTEGDELAEESFKLMTTQERAMHDKAKSGFNERYVESIREAVRQRIEKPHETETPFIDIANIIKFCNENILIPEDYSNNTDGQSQARKARFSNQDKVWYNKILQVANGVAEIKEEPKTRGAEEREKERVRFDLSNTMRNQKIKEKKRIEVDKSMLIQIKDYRDIKYLARGCDEAIQVIQKAVDQGRPLTLKDKDKIIYEKSICETEKLRDNL